MERRNIGNDLDELGCSLVLPALEIEVLDQVPSSRFKGDIHAGKGGFLSVVEAGNRAFSWLDKPLYL